VVELTHVLGPPLIDEAALWAFLRPHLPEREADGNLAVGRINEGHSNLTFALDAGGTQYVLRRPPLGSLAPTAHDVLREHRFLVHLHAAGAPVPRPVVACDDAAVIGAPFYVMDHVEGTVVRDSLPDELADPSARLAVSAAMIDTLVEIHALDWKSTGLAELARPTNYVERQIHRWRSQWDHNQTREIPDVTSLAAWFSANLPKSPAATIVHGDYKLDNVIFDLSGPKAVAVVDWEMATIGDPLADLGYLTALWAEPGEAVVGHLRLGGATSSPGFMSRRELVERYAAASGRNVEQLRWYQAFALWKLAVLLEGSYKRFLAGTTDDAYFLTLEEGVPELVARAKQLAESTV
jgi:aminoglycoside phosphotransferase (APT) family kinase protein